ncbi:MAG: FG-GAP repeat protein [Phycisphaerales bacterium]
MDPPTNMASLMRIAFLLLGPIVAAPVALEAQPCFVQKIHGNWMGGSSVAIDGEWALVNSKAFHRTAEGWVRVEGIVGGSAVAMGDSVAVAGVPTYTDDAGAFFVSTLDPDKPIWHRTGPFKSSRNTAGAHFGEAVAYDGQRILVGSPRDRNLDGIGAGAAYLFEYINDTWQETRIFDAPIIESGGRFGAGVDIDGDQLIIAASGIIDGRGKAFLYDFNGSDWILVAVLDQGRNSFFDANFGMSIDLDGDRCVIGAPTWGGKPKNWLESNGNIFYYEKRNGTWQLIEDLNGQLTPCGSWVGWAVKFQDDFIYAGAPGQEHPDAPEGAVYVFQISGDRLIRTRVIDDPNTDEGGAFGRGVDVDGDTLLVGAPFDDEFGANAGAGFIFSLGGECGETATLTNITATRGTILSGGLKELAVSDNNVVRARSQFGFLSSEPNVLTLRIDAETAVDPVNIIHVLIDARLNNPAGIATLRLYNVFDDRFDTVDEFELGIISTTNVTNVSPGVLYVDDTNNGRVQLSLKTVVVATFSTSGFIASVDRVRVGVE